MTLKLWTLYGALSLAFTGAYLAHEGSARGELRNRFLQAKIYPGLQRISSIVTDLKFRIRGPRKPKEKIAIVEIDSSSIDVLGRWPWRRDYLAYLIDKTFQAGAKVVALDVLVADHQPTVPEEFEESLKRMGLASLLKPYDYDGELEAVIRRYSDKLILSWLSESPCRPLYFSKEQCPVTKAEALESHPADFPRLAFPFFVVSPFLPEKTPLFSVPTVITDLPRFSEAGRHAGFANDFRDADGVVRRTSLVVMANGHAHPSLALETARTALNEKIEMTLDDHQRISLLRFAGSGRIIPVTPSGMMEINFRGAERSYPYVSAIDVLRDESQEASERKKPLKDAYALIGVTALAAADIGATPFDRAIPGVEVQATLLDNLLASDWISPGPWSRVALVFLMVVGALTYAVLGNQLEAYPALALSGTLFSALFFVDSEILFQRNQNWNTAFLYLELGCFLILILATKYIREENGRKFLRVAFSKYVAPAVVDSLIRDPSRLSVGGKREILTVLFCDIRGFTGFSEQMDPRLLAEFLNEYLGLMTEVVFDHGGTLDKYIGDALMAFWGAPLAQSDHSARACRAALAMTDLLAYHRSRFEARYGIRVHAGIGINTGPVTVGNMGSKRSFGYTVIGDAVNMASRLETATKYFGVPVLATRATLESSDPVPPFRPIGPLIVKGKHQAVDVVQLIDSSSALRFPWEGLKNYQEGLNFVRQSHWKEAIDRFEKALAQLSPSPDSPDLPSLRYLEKCRELAESKAPGEWDGSWILD